jgi:hypothetical protein
MPPRLEKCLRFLTFIGWSYFFAWAERASIIRSLHKNARDDSRNSPLLITEGSGMNYGDRQRSDVPLVIGRLARYGSHHAPKIETGAKSHNPSRCDCAVSVWTTGGKPNMPVAEGEDSDFAEAER